MLFLPNELILLTVINQSKDYYYLYLFCTLSSICKSDIITDFPFSRVTFAVEGKQPSKQTLSFIICSFGSKRQN